MNTRALVIFLGINVVCSVAIGYKYFSQSPTDKEPVLQQQSVSLIGNVGNPKTTPSTSPSILEQSGVLQAGGTPLPVNAAITTNPSSPSLNTTQASPSSPMEAAMKELKTQTTTINPIESNNSATAVASAPVASANETEKNNTMVQHILNLQGKQNNVPSSNPIEVQNKVCTILGPLDLKDKATLDVILSKDANFKMAQVEVSQKPIYEIYWNLGKNREEAEELFQKQKQNGTMQEDKFVLFQDEEKQWIVPIAEINSSESYAKSMATQLAVTANKNNAGGKWNYRTKPNAYFYKFDDFSLIDKKTKQNIDVMLNANKVPC